MVDDLENQGRGEISGQNVFQEIAKFGDTSGVSTFGVVTVW
ncbi:MAG: hypothetical protein R3F44_09645 [Candidatus Competibacteraceae bacterium]